MAIKNFWSLTVDEAIAADKLRQVLRRDYQVFFPANSQLKDVDLIVYNLKNGKTKTVQVKGSRTYEQNGDYYSWNKVKKNSIFNPTNIVDFFIFVIHLPKITKTKRRIGQAYLVIPIKELKKKAKQKKLRKGGDYHFQFWIDEKKKQAWDYNNPKNEEIDFSKYLNNFNLLKK